MKQVKTTMTLAKALPVDGDVFTVEGRPAFLIMPERVAVNGITPWVWYAPTLPGLPGAEETWMFRRFLDVGIAISGIDVGESYGSPAGRAGFSALYTENVKNRELSETPCLLARSRGGLMLYNWAVEHPASVACVAGIYPVCNLSSYPGIEAACEAYGMTAEQLTTRLSEHNPVDRLKPLAEVRVPIYHIHGDRDEIVPIERNSGELAQRYRETGGEVTLNVVKGGGHDHWTGWFQCEGLVEFVILHARRDIPNQRAQATRL